MRSRWILIGQSFPKTIRTIEDKIIPCRGGRNPCASPRVFAVGFGRLAVNGLIDYHVMHQSIPGVPIPPGAFAHVASPGGGAFAILSRPGD